MYEDDAGAECEGDDDNKALEEDGVTVSRRSWSWDARQAGEAGVLGLSICLHKRPTPAGTGTGLPRELLPRGKVPRPGGRMHSSGHARRVVSGSRQAGGVAG